MPRKAKSKRVRKSPSKEQSLEGASPRFEQDQMKAALQHQSKPKESYPTPERQPRSIRMERSNQTYGCISDGYKKGRAAYGRQR